MTNVPLTIRLPVDVLDAMRKQVTPRKQGKFIAKALRSYLGMKQDLEDIVEQLAMHVREKRG